MTANGRLAGVLRLVESGLRPAAGRQHAVQHLGGYLRRHPSRYPGIGSGCHALLLVYYKYTGFFSTLDAALELGWRVEDIILPLAISFFTFQQIAYRSTPMMA